MSLTASILRELAGAPPPALVVRCCRCRDLHPPGPRALCRKCLEETQDLFCDDTAEGLVLGNA